MEGKFGISSVFATDPKAYKYEYEMLLRSRTLSSPAKVILRLLLQEDENWMYCIKEKQDAYRRAVSELTSLGLVKRYQIRDKLRKKVRQFVILATPKPYVFPLARLESKLRLRKFNRFCINEFNAKGRKGKNQTKAKEAAK